MIILDVCFLKSNQKSVPLSLLNFKKKIQTETFLETQNPNHFVSISLHDMSQQSQKYFLLFQKNIRNSRKTLQHNKTYFVLPFIPFHNKNISMFSFLFQSAFNTGNESLISVKGGSEWEKRSEWGGLKYSIEQPNYHYSLWDTVIAHLVCFTCLAITHFIPHWVCLTSTVQ